MIMNSADSCKILKKVIRPEMIKTNPISHQAIRKCKGLIPRIQFNHGMSTHPGDRFVIQIREGKHFNFYYSLGFISLKICIFLFLKREIKIHYFGVDSGGRLCLVDSDTGSDSGVMESQQHRS